VKAIAIYAEGGGDHPGPELRVGFDTLLKAQKEAARARRLRWSMVLCGGRKATCDAFLDAVRPEPEVVNVLLVDSEGPVAPETGDTQTDAAARRQHLKVRDGWNLDDVDAERVHLMVQCMEAWIVSDPEALAAFYGQYFKANALPARQNLEEEPKQDLYDKLDNATSDKRLTKGRYGKIRHASQLLKRIDPAKVAVRCPRFATFTRWLDATIAVA
jgi:hypothetical protein